MADITVEELEAVLVKNCTKEDIIAFEHALSNNGKIEDVAIDILKKIASNTETKKTAKGILVSLSKDTLTEGVKSTLAEKVNEMLGEMVNRAIEIGIPIALLHGQLGDLLHLIPSNILTSGVLMTLFVSIATISEKILLKDE